MIRHRGNRKGNVVAMLFGSVALVGLLGASIQNLVIGPATTVNKVTQQNMTQNDLLMNAKVVVMHASTLPQMGDEDGDGYIEPVAFVPTSDTACNITLPGQGGCLPVDIGAIQTDPWGTQYAYCVWDHGDPASSANRIDGEDSTSGAVLAIISAGPNKQFETPCLPYDGDPDTNDAAINPNGIGDDLVQIFTYAGAVAGSGGLWELKLNEPETAVIDKKLEVGDVAGGTGFAFDTATGTGEFPYVKTDFIASKSGGNTPVTMDSNIALDGRWLSGDGESEGVFVANNGRVGIGISNPSRSLHVNGHVQATTYWIRGNTRADTFEDLYALTNSDDLIIGIVGSGGSAGGNNTKTIMNVDNNGPTPDDPLVFVNAGTEGIKTAMAILGDGRVGIGTDTPNSRLQIGEGSILSGGGNISRPTASIIADDINDQGTALRLKPVGKPGAASLVAHNSDDTVALTVMEGGSVGIGTRAPNTAVSLHVYNPDRRAIIQLESPNASNTDQQYIALLTDDGDGHKGIGGTEFGIDSGAKGWAIYARGGNYGGPSSLEHNDFGLSYFDGDIWKSPLTVDSETGNVGIGTKRPLHLLHVAGPMRIDGNSGPIMFLGNETTSEGAPSTDGAVIQYVNSGVVGTSSNDVLLFEKTDANGVIPDGGIVFSNRGMDGIRRVAMAIRGGGRVGIGETEPSHLLHVNGVARSTQASFATSSDRRVKDDIEPLADGLDTIIRLRPVSFRYKPDYTEGKQGMDGLKRGFIAQEVEAIVPEMVTRAIEDIGSGQTVEDFRILNNADFTPILVKAVQELKAENDTLRAANDNFRRELDELKAVIGE